MAEPHRPDPIPVSAGTHVFGLRDAEKGCTFSLDYEFPLRLNLGKSVIQGRKHRDVTANRGDRIKPCTQPP